MRTEGPYWQLEVIQNELMREYEFAERPHLTYVGGAIVATGPVGVWKREDRPHGLFRTVVGLKAGPQITVYVGGSYFAELSELRVEDEVSG
jgi:hypothetical protein